MKKYTYTFMTGEVYINNKGIVERVDNNARNNVYFDGARYPSMTFKLLLLGKETNVHFRKSMERLCLTLD